MLESRVRLRLRHNLHLIINKRLQPPLQVINFLLLEGDDIRLGFGVAISLLRIVK